MAVDDAGSACTELEPIRRFRWEKDVLRCVLPPMTKLVALVLATYADADGGNAHPGEDRLAVACGLSDRTVRDHLARLRDLGLIERTFSGSAAGRRKLADCHRLTEPTDLVDRIRLTNDPALDHRNGDAGDRRQDHRNGNAGDRARNTGS
jgi:DNA-binding transcriptional ArsR family regulator